MGRHARDRPPHRIALGAVALLGAATAVGGVVGLGLDLRHPDSSAAALDTGPVAVQPSPATGQQGLRPRTLTIPAIKVHSGLESLGLSASGALDVPGKPADAGWYAGGAVPGAAGPAVLVGHVDSLTGPAVFSRLSLLRLHDVINVALSDGSSARFQVTAVQRYPKDHFPTDAVYGPQPDPQLRLITCGGAFDGHRYADNVVVFARLAPRAA